MASAGNGTIFTRVAATFGVVIVGALVYALILEFRGRRSGSLAAATIAQPMRLLVSNVPPKRDGEGSGTLWGKRPNQLSGVERKKWCPRAASKCPGCQILLRRPLTLYLGALIDACSGFHKPRPGKPRFESRRGNSAPEGTRGHRSRFTAMRTSLLPIVTVLCAALALPAIAQKGGDHGNSGKSQGNSAPGNRGQDNRGQDNRGQDNRGDNRGQDIRGQDSRGHSQQDAFVVVDRDRTTVSSYYRDEFARGNCPPGLAKKDNGCLPPGQAKKMWAVGQPLPPSVVYYPLPQPLYSRLTPPPPGYEYVRVDDDVLLLQTANRSVVNLIVNLR